MPAPYGVTYLSANVKRFKMSNATQFDSEGDSLVMCTQRPAGSACD